MVTNSPMRVCPSCGRTRRFAKEKCMQCRQRDAGEIPIEEVEQMLAARDRQTWNLPDPPPDEDER